MIHVDYNHNHQSGGDTSPHSVVHPLPIYIIYNVLYLPVIHPHDDIFLPLFINRQLGTPLARYNLTKDKHLCLIIINESFSGATRFN